MNLENLKHWIDGFLCGKKGALPQEFLEKVNVCLEEGVSKQSFLEERLNTLEELINENATYEIYAKKSDSDVELSQ